MSTVKTKSKKKLWGDNERVLMSHSDRCLKTTRKHKAQDIWFILACLRPCYFFWVFLSCFLHCYHMSLHPSSETSLLQIRHVLKLLPGQTKRIGTCWVLKVSGSHAVAWPRPPLCQHPQAPTQPARLRLGCCIGSRSAGARAGNSWLCTQTVRISLLARGELCLSQLAGIYKYLWHSLHYYFSWAVNIWLLIAGKKLAPL